MKKHIIYRINQLVLISAFVYLATSSGYCISSQLLPTDITLLDQSAPVVPNNPQQTAVSNQASSPSDLLNPVATGGQDPSLSAAGIYRMGGQLYSPRYLNTSGVTVGTATVTGVLNVTATSVTLPTGNISVGTISPSLGSLASGVSILGAFDDIANARVVQIVQGTFSNQSNTTSASFSATGLTVNITPQNVNNRILVLASGILINVSASTIAKATIMRGSTNLGSSSGMSWNLSSVSLEIPCTMVYLDSPATTSQVTYAVGTASNNGGTVAWGDGTSIQSNIVAIEIGQ